MSREQAPRLRFGEQLGRVLTTIGLADDFEVVFQFERGDKTAADDEMIIDEQECDHAEGNGRVTLIFVPFPGWLCHSRL